MLIDVAILPKMVPIIIVQLIGWISFHFFMNYILSCMYDLSLSYMKKFPSPIDRSKYFVIDM